VAHNSHLRSLLQCRTHCLLLCLSLSSAQSVYRLSLSCCSAEHSVCYSACPSLLHSQCTVCLCPAAVQNTVSATVPVPLSCTVSVLSVSVLLQCRAVSATVTVPLCHTVYPVSDLLQCRTVSATVSVPLFRSQCTICLWPTAVQNTLSATVSVPLCHTVSVLSVSVLLQCRTHCLLLCLSFSAGQSVYCLSLSCTVGMPYR
jgi:hypothetical protein